MNTLLKRLASHLPLYYQQILKQLYFKRQIEKGTFITDEEEFKLLQEWITEGDWVLDIGANIGHYTKRFSELVGTTGRVIAFEPVSETFEILAANTARFSLKNVSLLNVASSDRTAIVGMNIPRFETGLDNYYMAHLTTEEANLQVVSISIDSLDLPEGIKLAKIDAEGHDMSVLQGMVKILKRDKPILIVEDNSCEIDDYLSALGYTSTKIPGSSNKIFQVS